MQTRKIPYETIPKGRPTMSNFNSSRVSTKFVVLALVALSAVLLSSISFAQTTVSTGGIAGTITDKSGAVLANVRVTVMGPTGQTLHSTTSDTGAYTAAGLIPGIYKVRVEAKGFKTAEVALDVRVNNTANGNVTLELGAESTVVEGQATEAQVTL